MLALSKLRHKTTAEIVFLLINILIGITTLFLLLPCYSGLKVFVRGDFTFIEAIAQIFLAILVLTFGLYLFYKRVKPKNIHNIIIVLGSLMVSGFFLALVISFVWIRYEVKSTCYKVVRQYGGNCQDSLLAAATDKNQPFIYRNEAIYALGQFADRKSLPVLKSMINGNTPTQESLYSGVSQYELQKAIRWCEQGNATSWMYFDREEWR